MTTSNQPQVRSTLGTNKKPVHARVRKDSGLDRLQAELFSILTTNMQPLAARQRLMRAAITAAKGVGGCHLIRKNNKWQLDTNNKLGRIPNELDLIEEHGGSLDEMFGANNPTVMKLNCLDELPAIFCRVAAIGAEPELLMLVLPDQSKSANAVEVANKVTAATGIILKGQFALESEWQIQTLAAIIELVGRVESVETQKSASETLVNELTRNLNCNSVAVATMPKGRLKVQAVSGIHKLDRGSATHQNYLQALRESFLREELGVFPAVEQKNDHLLMAHKQLASVIQTEAVISQPLVTNDGEEIGAWLFTGPKEMIQSERFSRFVEAASMPVADALQVSHRAQKSWLRRTINAFKSKLSWFTKIMIPFAIIGTILLMLIPITYRVRCNCTTEPISKRFAVAPFEGLITSGYVEPGDLVKQGQVLAEIDGRTIRWELTGVTAEKQTSLRQREVELVEENIPKLFLAELENERLTAQESILKFKNDNLKIRSPIDGVVLSGSLERSEASSVETGQVLFEVGPIDAIKVQIEIPADEIAQVKKGHEVKIWIEGNEEEPLKAAIEKIHPRSVIRDAKNVFIAELKFENENERFRPGMKGSVRIDCDKRSLGWSLFHKPVNHVRSRLTWW